MLKYFSLVYSWCKWMIGLNNCRECGLQSTTTSSNEVDVCAVCLERQCSVAAEGTEFYLLDISLKYICLLVCMRIFNDLQFFPKVKKESNMRFPEQSHVFFFVLKTRGKLQLTFLYTFKFRISENGKLINQEDWVSSWCLDHEKLLIPN